LFAVCALLLLPWLLSNWVLRLLDMRSHPLLVIPYPS
jgi:hypothetical protein